MKIIQWNVNGLRSLLKHESANSLEALLQLQDPEILMMTETKLNAKQYKEECAINERFRDYRYKYYNHSISRLGYSGTSVWSKVKPLRVFYGFNLQEVDNITGEVIPTNIDVKNESQLNSEGRLIILEFSKVFTICVYTPNSGSRLNRLPFRIREWDFEFKSLISKLQKKKKVIVCGDFNVARDEIDLSNPKSNRCHAGFTVQERMSFKSLLEETKLVDTFRELYPDRSGAYSFWSSRSNSRNRNIGWRVDYCLVSKTLFKHVKTSDILHNIYGSDHAPVLLNLDIQLK